MNETLSLCKHDIPVKLGCKKCIDEAINNKEFCVSSFAFAIRCCIDTLETRYDNLKARISELEEWTRKDEDAIYARLKEIERFQDITHLEYQNRRKKPHVCPLCEGSGNKKPYTKSGVLYIEQPCNSCDSEGIIWG